jgi:hypothetical protein
MILDKLIEKKDIQAYISWRIRCLNLDLGNIPKIPNPRRRETAKRHIMGRINELKRMREVVTRGAKRDSENACRDYHISMRKLGLKEENTKKVTKDGIGDDSL